MSEGQKLYLHLRGEQIQSAEIEVRHHKGEETLKQLESFYRDREKLRELHKVVKK